VKPREHAEHRHDVTGDENRVCSEAVTLMTDYFEGALSTEQRASLDRL
jgi:hypothetical protein